MNSLNKTRFLLGICIIGILIVLVMLLTLIRPRKFDKNAAKVACLEIMKVSFDLKNVPRLKETIRQRFESKGVSVKSVTYSSKPQPSFTVIFDTENDYFGAVTTFMEIVVPPDKYGDEPCRVESTVPRWFG